MVGVRITLDTRNLDRLHHTIQGLSDLDTSTLMPRLGEYLLSSTQDRFSSQTAPDGTAWQALQPRTIKYKRHNPARILTERGSLRRSIHYQKLGPDSVAVGTNLVYGATHQYGRGGIPARPFLGLSNQDRDNIRSTIQDWAQSLGFR